MDFLPLPATAFIMNALLEPFDLTPPLDDALILKVFLLKQDHFLENGGGIAFLHSGPAAFRRTVHRCFAKKFIKVMQKCEAKIASQCLQKISQHVYF